MCCFVSDLVDTVGVLLYRSLSGFWDSHDLLCSELATGEVIFLGEALCGCIRSCPG